MSPENQNRKSEKLATRQRILVAARAHFERDGFATASIRAIATDANVAAGTVLLHFTDKLGVLHASLHDDLERAIESSLAASNRGALLTRLCAIIRPFFEYYAARPTLSKTLLRESLLADSPWKEHFGAQFVRVYMHLVSLLEKARLKGEVRKDTNSEVVISALLSFYYFALIGWVQGAPGDPMDFFKSLLKQHLQACAPHFTRVKDER